MVTAVQEGVDKQKAAMEEDADRLAGDFVLDELIDELASQPLSPTAKGGGSSSKEKLPPIPTPTRGRTGTASKALCTPSTEMPETDSMALQREESGSFYQEYVVNNPVARFSKTLALFKPYTRDALLTMVGLKVVWGFNNGIMAGVMLFAPQVLDLDEVEQEFVMGSANYSAGLAAISLGWMTKAYGCKESALVSTLIFLSGVGLMTFAWDFDSMLVGRVLVGAAYGVSVVTVNSYLVDLSPVKLRGAAGCLAEVGVQVGITTGYIVALLFYAVDHHYNWRLMLGSALIPSGFLFFRLLGLPETPRFLVTQDCIKEARQVLLDTLDAEDVEPSLARCEAFNMKERVLEPVSFQELLTYSRPVARKALGIGLMLTIFQQLSGESLLVVYIPQIMKDAGYQGKLLAMFGSIAVGVMRLMATFVGLSLIDDDKGGGRRRMMLTSILGSAASMALLSIAITMITYGIDFAVSATLATVAVLGFVTFFELGMGPVTWVLASEVTPARERPLSLAVCSLAARLTGGTVLSSFLTLKLVITEGGAFAFFAGLSALHAVLAYAFYPETKGKTLEEIEEQLMTNDAKDDDDEEMLLSKSRIWRTKSREYGELRRGPKLDYGALVFEAQVPVMTMSMSHGWDEEEIPPEGGMLPVPELGDSLLSRGRK